MKSNLPSHASKYLIESLNKRTSVDINFELNEALGSLDGRSSILSTKNKSDMDILPKPDPTIGDPKDWLKGDPTIGDPEGWTKAKPDEIDILPPADKTKRFESPKDSDDDDDTLIGSIKKTAGDWSDWTTNSGKYNVKPNTDLINQLPGGGGGIAAPRGKKGEPTGAPSKTNILFGDSEKGDWGLGHAAGFYMSGKAAEAAAKGLEKFGPQIFGKMVGAGKWFPKGNSLLGDIGQSIAGGFLSGIPGAGAKVLKQLGDISGANFFDANIGNIGQSAMQLGVQGAGKPWTPFIIPGPRGTKTARYDPDYDLNKQIAKAQKEKEYDRLRRLGYINP